MSLQSHLGKVFELVVGARLYAHLERILYGVNITQFGCMIGKGTDDALLISSIISLSAIKNNISLYKCYIDLIKAYDRVNRGVLFEILERRGVPPKLLGVIRGLYDNVDAKVQLNGQLSESFNLTVGVKQGGVISGILFCVYMGAVIEKVHDEFRRAKLEGINMTFSTRGQRGSRRLTIYEILFVDDWLMMAKSMRDLTLMMNIALKIIRKFGLEISWPKTQFLVIENKILPRILEAFVVDGKQIEALNI